MRWLLLLTLLLLPSGLVQAAPADNAPPEIVMPALQALKIRILADELSVLPGKAQVYMRFSGRVTCESPEFKLMADVLELDVTPPADLQEGLALPEPPAPERVVRDPGDTIAAMARELKLPRPKVGDNSIQRVGAKGHVRIEAQGMRLDTTELVSSDGGRSWAATSRSTLSGKDPESGGEIVLAADKLLFDSETQRALARGEIRGSFTRPDDLPLTVEAERVELNIQTSELIVSEYMLVKYGTYQVCCGSLLANLEQGTAEVGDNPRLGETASGVTAGVGSITVDLESQTLVASGGVTVTEPERGLTLTAERVEVDFGARRAVATGQPELTYQGSFYRGEQITVEVRADNSAVVEVEGEQEAEINLDQLPQAP